MPASLTATAQGHRSPCPHCGKHYRTLVKRHYMLKIDGAVKQSLPMGSQWRCLACGKSYTTDDE
jgi:hypothetical protein